MSLCIIGVAVVGVIFMVCGIAGENPGHKLSDMKIGSFVFYTFGLLCMAIATLMTIH
jgi:hypothetical protein